MMRTLAGFAAIVGALTLAAPDSLLFAQSPNAWRTLFDGRSIDGWDITGDANWKVSEGVVRASQGNGYLVTPVEYGNFQISLDFWVTPDANSGVFIRCADPKMITAMNCYEVNIFDLRPDQSFRTGGIVNVAKPSAVINTGHKWNTFDITARGSRFTVILNGTKVVDNAENADRPRGYIALQYGTGVVRFRNVRIRTL